MAFASFSRHNQNRRRALVGLEPLEQRLLLVAELHFTDSVEGLAVDASENKYVYYGRLHGTVDIDPSPTRAQHITGTAFNSWDDNNGRYLVKYSPSNEVLWTKPMAELPGLTRGMDLKVAPDETGVEHLYALGNSVSKLTLNGVTVWTQKTSAWVIESHVDTNGAVYATGQIQSSADLDVDKTWPDGRDLVTAKGQGVYVAKWSPGGELQWSRAIQSSTSDTAGVVSVGDISISNGIVYLGGIFDGTLSLGGLTNQRIDSSSTKYDGFVATYDTAGNYRSVAHFIDGEVDHLRVAGNEVYLTATFGYTADMDPGAGQKLLTPINLNGDALAVAKLTYSAGDAVTAPSWNLNWAHGFASSYNNVAGGLQVSGSNVYISGMFGETTDFNPDPAITYNLVAGGSSEVFGRGDIFVLNLATVNGGLQWVSQIGSTVRLAVENQEIADVVVGVSGSLHLSGHIAHGPVHFGGPGGAANPILNGGLDTDAFIGKLGADGSYQGGFNVGAIGRTMDNGDPGYTEVGSWKNSTNGWEGDSRSNTKGSGADKASWTFTGLPNGTYQVITQFPAGKFNASNAPFRVNGTLAVVDQKTAPNDYYAGIISGYWENVGTFAVTNGTLQVELSDAANGTVVADAIRIWSVTPAAALSASAAPPVGVRPGGGLRVADIDAVYAEAIARWQAVGVDTSALDGVTVQVSDLAGPTLGQAQGSTILLDRNAAGWGWYIDATPEDDNEFLWPGNQGEKHRIDLLTVLMHEMGHILGVEHQEQGLMAETLAAGTRHSPENGTSDEFFAQLGDDANAYASLWFAESESLEQKKAARVRTKRSPALHDLRTFHQGRGGI